jgi:hypothetical protein
MGTDGHMESIQTLCVDSVLEFTAMTLNVPDLNLRKQKSIEQLSYSSSAS